jgi:aminoglycoside phosphotransferase (APT) family kinase protein
VSLEACLPRDLRGPGTAITRVGAGLSGAGVHRVEAAGESYILKVAGEESLDGWRRKLHFQRLAAEAGLAPAIVHVDEGRRAVVSRFVADRSFFALWGNPATRDAALVLLGRMLRRVHDLPLPPGAPTTDSRGLLAALWSGLASFALPAFVGDAVRRALDEDAPASERASVLSHNDVNPTNLLYDGEHLLLFDWETAGSNDPFYDLAAIAVFLRMDDDTCKQLLAVHDGAPVAVLPARFAYDRRFVAALCGTAFLHLARNSGHPGAAGETLASTPPLADFYQRLRAGELAIASADGQWWFGLALVKASVDLSPRR